MSQNAHKPSMTFEGLHRNFLALHRRAAALEAENQRLRATQNSGADESTRAQFDCMARMLDDACRVIEHLTAAKQELEEELDRLEAREMELEAQLKQAQTRGGARQFNAVEQLKARLRAIREEKAAKMAA